MKKYIIKTDRAGEFEGQVFDSYESAYNTLSDYFWVKAAEQADKYTDTISDVGAGEIIEQLAEAYIKVDQSSPGYCPGQRAVTSG